MSDSETQRKLEKLEKLEKDNRARVRRYMEKVKGDGKKQISAIVSGETYEEILRRKKASQPPLTAGQVIDQAIMGSIDTDVKTDVNINVSMEGQAEETAKPIQETQTETPGPGSEKSTEKKEFDKDKICKIIVDLRDNKKMAYEAIAAKLKEKGYSPKTEGKDSFHHSTISNYYNDAKKKTKKN